MRSEVAKAMQVLGAIRPRVGPPRAPGRRLRADEVDVWRAVMEPARAATLAFYASLLSEDELARAQRFFFERDRQRVIVARGILRLLLARYTGRKPRALRFVYGPNGKPALAREAGEPAIFFNVAHAEDVALYAFSSSADVGVDVERVRKLPEWQSIANSCFAPEEAERIRACPEAMRAEEFLRAWTRHEAVLKAAGVGLAGAGGPTVRPMQEYAVHSVEAGAGFIGALAVGDAVRWANARTWPGATGWIELTYSGQARRTNLETKTQHSISFP